MSRDAPPPLPDVALLVEALGVPVDPELLEQAMTHRSYAYEQGGLPTNERLEFLGDVVLSLVVTTALYQAHPERAEGELAKLRASVVNMTALAGVARELGLGAWLRLGRGEDATGGRDKASLLADALEAVIGAVYLSGGGDAASTLVTGLFGRLLAESADRGAALDWKTSLQELTAAQGLGVPEYAVTESGPDHEKSFVAAARVQGRPLGEGSGRSKKEAEMQAAAAAWTALSDRSPAAVPVEELTAEAPVGALPASDVPDVPGGVDVPEPPSDPDVPGRPEVRAAPDDDPAGPDAGA